MAKNEILMVNIGSTSEGGRVVSVKADLYVFSHSSSSLSSHRIELISSILANTGPRFCSTLLPLLNWERRLRCLEGLINIGD